MTETVYLGLGSNLKDPVAQIMRAIDTLKRNPGIAVIHISPLYQSTAVGPGEQPDYVNAVIALSTNMAPETLLDTLQDIETQQGRQRLERWGPRTLDLDMLLYSNQEINTPRLTVPHPRISERNFVIYPLFDIAPKLTLPTGQSLSTLCSKLTNTGLQRLSSSSP